MCNAYDDDDSHNHQTPAVVVAQDRLVPTEQSGDCAVKRIAKSRRGHSIVEAVRMIVAYFQTYFDFLNRCCSRSIPSYCLMYCCDDVAVAAVIELTDLLATD